MREIDRRADEPDAGGRRNHSLDTVRVRPRAADLMSVVPMSVGRNAAFEFLATGQLPSAVRWQDV